MSILVVSPDLHAARALDSALERAGEVARWEREFDRRTPIQTPPLVLVADTEDPLHEELILRVRERAPWVRVHVMGRCAPPGCSDAIVVPKPFDATKTAALLSRSRELAELERKRQSLKAQADELAILVESTFEAIIGLGADGSISTWNRGAEKMYGYTADEAIGRNVGLLEAGHPSVTPATTRAVEEVTRRHKDGSALSVLLSRSPVPAAMARGLGFAEVSLDVTRRRELERELEHSERLATIGRLVATVAHEINNPLAVISASSNYLSDCLSGTGNTEIDECLSDMKLAANRVADFVKQMCGFSRRSQLELTEQPLEESVSTALRLVKPRAGNANVEILLDPDSSETAREVLVPHDPPRLAQALVNLVANAVDAAAGGGGHAWISLIRGEGVVQLIIEDDGPGIAPATASRLFEPFHTTKPHGHGTGLGLAVTRQIMADHRGEVRLEPRQPTGVRATLSLPVLEPAALSVLVVEDDRAVRRVVIGELERAGFQVHGSASLEQALERIAGCLYQVIVTDLTLGDASGRDVVRALERAARDARIVTLTGDPTGEALPEAAIQLGKPWRTEVLVSAVRSLCVGSARVPMGDPNGA